MLNTPGQGAYRRPARSLRETNPDGLFDRRRRGHLALLVSILAVSVFGYIVLQPRTVRVQADGRDFTIETMRSKDTALLRSAGIELGPGDRVTALDDGGAEVLRVERARLVTLTVDGVKYEIRTRAATIDELLVEAGVALGERDSVLQNGLLVSVRASVEPPLLLASRGPVEVQRLAAQSPRNDIQVRRAVPFTIDDGGRELVTTSSHTTVAQALREAGITVGPGDELTPPAQSPLTSGERVQIKRARALTVTLPGEHRVLYTLAPTVGDALDAAGIAVPAGAFLDPPADSPVVSGMTVRVVQLSAASDLERDYVASDTVYREDPSLSAGETRVIEGRDGVRVRRYAISYVDGEEAGRELLEEYWETEPVDTVVYHGPAASVPAPVQQPAAPAPRDTSAPDLSGATTLYVYATWYNAASAGRAPSDPDYGRTATGVIVNYGIVAVDPAIIPLGTRMYIPGYGYAVAADTGGAVKGYIIDLGYPDGVVVDWRSRWLDIYILP